MHGRASAVEEIDAMKMMRYAALLAAVAIVGACSDTGATDWRFIDQLEYSPTMIGMTFRNFSPYQGTAPGARRLRIFPSSSNIAVTTQFFIDTVLTFEAGKYYTIIHTGLSRTGSTPADFIRVIEDVLPATVANTNFATRFVHLGTGLGAQDAYAVATTTTTVVGATPMFTNVAYNTESAYNSAVPLGAMAFRAANTGTTTVTASALAPAGSAADPTNNLTAIAGTSVGSSVFTAYYFPRSVAGSAAPQTTAFTNPAIIYIADRHPN
jgi:hypothetical protein